MFGISLFCVAPTKLTFKGITSQDTEALFPAIHQTFSIVCCNRSWLVKRNFMEERMQTKKRLEQQSVYVVTT